MKRQSKQIAVNSQSFSYLKSLLGPDTKIVDIFVENRWLCALLGSGVKFMVKNNPFKKNEKETITKL